MVFWKPPARPDHPSTMAAPDDDFAAFMAEIEQAAPIEGAALPSASDGAVVGSKRERGEEEGEEGGSMTFLSQ